MSRQLIDGVLVRFSRSPINELEMMVEVMLDNLLGDWRKRVWLKLGLIEDPFNGMTGATVMVYLQIRLKSTHTISSH